MNLSCDRIQMCQFQMRQVTTICHIFSPATMQRAEWIPNTNNEIEGKFTDFKNR